MKNFYVKSREKTNLIKIIALLLSVIFTMSFIGCNNDDGDKLDNSSNHYFSAEVTEDYLVHKAKSDYKIVIPKDADDNEITAGRELQYFFKIAPFLKK